MTLQKLMEALNATELPCFHFSAAANGEMNEYIVWAEDGGKGTHADNRMHNKFIGGTIDLFTREEFPSAQKKVEAALNSIDIAWALNSIQPEDGKNGQEKTGYTHYEWTWEMVMDGES